MTSKGVTCQKHIALQNNNIFQKLAYQSTDKFVLSTIDFLDPLLTIFFPTWNPIIQIDSYCLFIDGEIGYKTIIQNQNSEFLQIWLLKEEDIKLMFTQLDRSLERFLEI